jgi:hemerythrin
MRLTGTGREVGRRRAEEEAALRWLWDPSFSVGVEQLDRQHEAIFRRLAEVQDSLAEAGAEGVRRGVASLREESAFHFRAEEEFLSGLRYPRLVQQEVQHRQFLRRLDDLDAHPETCSASALDGLGSWLAGHMVGLDGEYAQWMREQETKASGKPT